MPIHPYFKTAGLGWRVSGAVSLTVPWAWRTLPLVATTATGRFNRVNGRSRVKQDVNNKKSGFFFYISIELPLWEFVYKLLR